MAIKGKGRTKGRQVARAPRREPVPVPVPFFRRRWVQIGLAFVIGLGVATTTVWATNGVRDNRRIEDEAADLIAQKTALETWRAKLDVQLATVGVLQYPNPPSVGERLATVLGQIVRGEETSISAEQLRQDADALKAAAKELEDYDLSKLIRDADAFEAIQTEWLLLSRSEFTKGFDAYRQATLLAIDALGAEEDQATDLATQAKGVADIGTGLLESAWRFHLNALRSADITVGLPGQDTGFIPQP